MIPEDKKIVDFHLQEYRRTGATGYHRKQYRRLIDIIDDILEHEPKCHKIIHIGRRQIIGYWERTKTESKNARLEKWRILCLFFEKSERKTPPKPKA